MIIHESWLGIQVYDTQKDNGTPVVVLVGVDASGKDFI